MNYAPDIASAGDRGSLHTCLTLAAPLQSIHTRCTCQIFLERINDGADDVYGESPTLNVNDRHASVVH